MESDIMLWILTKETQQQKQKTKRQKGSPFEKKSKVHLPRVGCRDLSGGFT